MRTIERLLISLLAICLLWPRPTPEAAAGENGLSVPGLIRDLHESSDGRDLLVLAEDTLYRISLARGRVEAAYVLPSGHRALLPLATPGKTLLLGERPGVHDAATGRVSGLSLPFVRERADGGDLVLLGDGRSMIFGLDREGGWRGAMPLVTAEGGGIRRIVVAPDGRRVAVIDRKGALHLLDFPARLDLAEVPGTTIPVVGLGFVGGGDEVAVIHADGRILLCDGRDGHETRNFPPTSPQEIVDAALGGTAIHLVARDGAIVSRRSGDGAVSWSRPADRRVSHLRLSMDGETLVAYGARSITILDARTGETRLSFSSPSIADAPQLASAEVAESSSKHVSPRLFVVALGIDRYARPDRRLAHAVADARAVASFFAERAEKRFASVETTIRVDDAVTDTALETLFGKLSATMTERDALVVYVAGHGRLIDGGFHLLPTTVDPDDDEAVRASGIRRARWDYWLSRLPIERGLLLVDTCESGRAGRRNLLTRRAALTLDRRGGFTPMPGLSIVTATSDYGQALDAVDGHGAVVTALMAATSAVDADGDGRIDAGELARFLAHAVPERTQRSHGWRQPVRVSLDRSGWAVLNATARPPLAPRF